jgi:hypothetical protein
MKEKLWRAWFWFSQIISLIGLISMLDDLRLWVATVRRLIALLDRWIPPLAALVENLGYMLHAVVETWRAVVHPPLELLFGWLPFEVPLIVRELLVVAAFVTTGWVRAARMWDKARRDRDKALQRIFQKYGLLDDIHRKARWVVEYISVHFEEILTPKPNPIFGSGVGITKLTHALQDALGPRIHAFLHDVRSDPELLSREREIKRASLWERPLKRFLAVSAAAVLLLVLGDVFLEAK